MLRHVLFLCFLLALYGCGDASKTPTATGNNAPREIPEAVKPESVSTAKPVTAARDPGAVVEEVDEMVETVADAKSNELTPSGDAVAVDKKKPDDDAKDDDAKDDEKEKGTTVNEAFAAAQKAAQKGDMKGALSALEKGFESNPDDANLLIALAKVNLNVGMEDRAKPEYPMYIKAADYIRLALKADPELSENPRFSGLASVVYYNEACALAVDKKTDEALKALQTAIESGYKDFAEMEKDTDLEAVRGLPTFSEVVAKARDAYFDNIFAQTKPFDFDFELNDIDGNAIAKADFKGKVLIVDVWGTWCPPCLDEVPHFVELIKKYKEEGLEIVGLNSEGDDDDADLKKVQEFHKDNGMNYRCALMKNDIKDEMLEQIPKMKYFPTTLFLDRTGKVRLRFDGARDYETLEAFVKRLLEEKSEETTGS